MPVFKKPFSIEKKATRSIKMSSILIGLTLSIVIAEIVLRILEPVIVSDKVLTASENKQVQLNTVEVKNLVGTSLYNTKLDTIIKRSSNNIGFRGPDLSPKDKLKTKIFVVGGSTTICEYLSDGFDWPSLVGSYLYNIDTTIWLNNAGIDGNSSFGHLQMLPKRVLPYHPDFIIFLVGCNDVEREKFTDHDNFTNRNIFFDTPFVFLPLYKISHLYRLLYNVNYVYQKKEFADRCRVYHQNIVFEKVGSIKTDSALLLEKERELQQIYLPKYKKRISALIELCKFHGATPIFLTQPTVLGNVTDPITYINLGQIAFQDINGEIYWNMLELYNTCLKDVCSQHNIKCIDLANMLPKRTDYYYDYFHFTNEGSAAVADIVKQQILLEVKKN